MGINGHEETSLTSDLKSHGSFFGRHAKRFGIPSCGCEEKKETTACHLMYQVSAPIISDEGY